MDSSLSNQQLEVISALSTGATLTAAAEQAGLHRNTLSNWRRNSPAFQQALSHAQYDRALLYREKLEQHIDLAIETISAILIDLKAPPSVRLKAALAIVNLAVTQPNPPILHKTAQSEIQPEPENQEPKPAPPPEIQVNPRPFGAKTRTPANLKIGRNATCPCGSGKKYKRCCQNPPISPEFVQRMAEYV